MLILFYVSLFLYCPVAGSSETVDEDDVKKFKAGREGWVLTKKSGI